MAACPEGDSYRHIDRCIAGRGVRLDMGSAAGVSIYDGCVCRDGNCTSVECSCMCMCAYDSTGRLKVEYFAAASRPVFECNSKCGCSSSCPNRVAQTASLNTLHVVQTEQKGKGVTCSHFLARGTFVGEYVGQIISRSDAKRRMERLSPDDACYVVTYKEHLSSGTVLTTNIDAGFAGNIMRFMNHSCNPNLTMVPIRVDSIVPRLCLFASRDIESGTELCFSYFGCGSMDLVDRKAVTLGKKECLCGSKNCLRFLPLQN